MKDDLKELADKIEKFGGNTQTEEATKAFFIAPFLKLLGYDVTSYYAPAKIHKSQL